MFEVFLVIAMFHIGCLQQGYISITSPSIPVETCSSPVTTTICYAELLMDHSLTQHLLVGFSFFSPAYQQHSYIGSTALILN